jgi:hypothetical protein
MSTLPPVLDYPATSRERSPLFAKSTLFVSLLPIFAVLFAIFDPLPNPGRGEPVAIIACLLAFLAAPPNLIAAIGFSFLYRDQPGPRSICIVAALISGLATGVTALAAVAILAYGVPC